MFATIERPATSYLDVALRNATKPVALSGVVTPEMAQRWVSLHAYSGQRRIRQDWVDNYADQMRQGDWQRIDADFVRDVDGSLVLVNGYHRLYALAHAGISLPAFVTLQVATRSGDVARIYGTYDSGKKRSFVDAAHASHLADDLGVKASQLRAIRAAVQVITSGFLPSAASESSLRSLARQESDVRGWIAEIQSYFAILQGTADSAQPFYRAAVMAVALVTLRYQPEAAVPFWSRAAADDGLRKGQPEHTLLKFLREKPAANTVLRPVYAYYIATAWNAAFHNEPLTLLRVQDVTASRPIRIEGTPYNGKALVLGTV